MNDEQSQTTNILNVQINTEKKAVILKKVDQLLKDGKQHYIVTPNPEIVMQAATDQIYLHILNNADLKLPDGIGLKLASFFTGNIIQQRIKGIDFIEDLCSIAQRDNYSVFFLGGAEGVAQKTATSLQTKFPQLNIKGSASGGKVSKDGVLHDKNIINKINQLQPNILFIAFGFPRQEKFIAKNLSKLPSVKLAIGVGGSFDVISSKVKRAPKSLQAIGLEWLWRLIIQPWRLKRIYTAIIRFPLSFMKWKLFNSNINKY
jgi:N-acetylglucosaminyldiphosphoundecaprenol N-acetyl-beta-D-mannosaminyltransferase